MKNMPTESLSVEQEIITEPTTQEGAEEISIASLLIAGAQFGHKTSNWNPKMAPFLYGSRNDIYVFNLEKTLEYWQKAREVIVKTAARGGEILLVGTKQQCKEAIKRESLRCGCMYVDNKWVGGTLTNLPTIKNTISKMKKMREFLTNVNDPGSALSLTKREKILMEREISKLEKQFGGIADIKKLPDMIFILDIEKHHLAIEEARTARIPIVAIVDSNTDPDLVDYVIPANDDSAGSLNLFLTNIADAVLEGKNQLQQSLLDAAEHGDLVLQEQELAKEEAEAHASAEQAIEPQNKPKVEKRKLKRKNSRPQKPFTKRQVCEGVMVYTEEAFEKENT